MKTGWVEMENMMGKGDYNIECITLASGEREIRERERGAD